MYAYGSHSPLQLKGQFELTLTVGRKSVNTEIIVTEEESKYPLLSEDTATKLDLISYNTKYLVNKIQSADTLKNSQSMRREIRVIIENNAEVFSGHIGKAKHLVDIMIDLEVRPVVQRGRKIPYNLQAKADEKLNRSRLTLIVAKPSRSSPFSGNTPCWHVCCHWCGFTCWCRFSHTVPFFSYLFYLTAGWANFSFWVE